MSQNLGPNRKDKVYNWLYFNVLIGLLPFLFDAISQASPREIPQIWGNLFPGIFTKKEIFLFCTAVAADALGSLIMFMQSQQRRVIRWHLFGPCLIIIGSACFLYAVAPVSQGIAMIMWIATLIVACWSKAVS